MTLRAELEQIALESATRAIENGAVDDAIERVIVQTVREGRDDGLSRVGFVMKIAVELIDNSMPPLSFKKARDMAYVVYEQFRSDNKPVKFGDEGWDWSGVGARELANAYEIEYWDRN